MLSLIRLLPVHLFLAVGATALAALPAFGHGGALNAEGCHHDRKRGEYHCHRALASAPETGAKRNNLTDLVSPAGRRVFRNCAQARAAGAAPVRRGDPGYGAHLDRDNDGIGCE